MIPTATDITYFLEVASTQNLSRAAERLGISQPSLTLSVQRLEKSVGVPLLVRGKKGVTLTSSGRQFVLHARGILESWQKLKDQTVRSRDGVMGSYVVGAHPAVAMYALEGLSELLSQFPELEISLTHDLSRKITEGVISMKIDVGVVVNPARHPDLVIKKLAEDEVTFWKSVEERSTHDLESSCGVLLFDPDLMQSQDLLRRFKAKHETCRRFAGSHLEILARQASQGLGVAILPSRVAALYPRLRRVRAAPVFKDDICVVFRMENREIEAIQTIVANIERQLKS